MSAPRPDAAHERELLLDMLRVRRLEEKSAELYSAGKIRGFLHLYIGEEAVAAGAMRALAPDDAIVATYREHGHALLRGVSAGAIMAEMYGKQEGCSRGRGGSMHLFDASRRFYGGNAIVGGGLPVAAGLALADALQGKRRVSACFFGEGAVAEGEFHESMNLAALWKLPVLFLCENNLYAMGTALERSESQQDLVLKASSYGMPAEAVDGMEVLAVERACRHAADAVREGAGPRFLELRTYRFRAHSMFDAELYRDKAEVEQWKRRDPIELLETRMRAEGTWRDEDRAALEALVAKEVEDAVAFAEAGTWEPVERLMDDVLAPPLARSMPEGGVASREDAPASRGTVGLSDAGALEQCVEERGPVGSARRVPANAGTVGGTTGAASRFAAQQAPSGIDRAGERAVKTTYREALRAGLREALARDPRVFLMGEDVGRYGGSFAVSRGLLDEFGPERVRDTPLSESAFVGAGIGAALGGARPIVEIMTVNFALLALDQIVNNAATLRHMSGGQVAVPLVIRMTTGAGRQLAAQHSHSLEGWFAHVPGLKVLAPGTLEDARGMLWPALEDGNPVLLFEHGQLLNMEGELAEPPPAVDIAHAAVRRAGRDVTLLTYGGCLPKCLKAAAELATQGIEAEVVDLRVLRPLDTETILGSVRRTRRAVVVDEGWKSGGLSAEIVARLVEGCFYDLDAPVGRVCAAEVPIPYPKHLEDAALPQVDGIVAAAREAVGAHA